MPSVDNELVLWNGTSGTQLKRATGSGPARLTSGVLSIADPPHMPWVSGRIYDPSSSIACSSWAGAAVTAQRAYAAPVYVPNDVTISEVATTITGVVASALGRLAIYTMGSDDKPGVIIWQGPTTIDMSAASVPTFTGVNQVLPGGKWYYVVFASDSAVTVHQSSSVTVAEQGYALHNDTSKIATWFKTITGLVLPDPFGTPTNTLAGMVRVSLKVA